ncbi:hypothetical protein [Chitiniphilus eburneus]|uniref:Oxidoreductase molybdopterin-binding domain-containing protein n=1 Tax=Chitiniphilus eburneus TaxID=2571148 RepID=A0A4U0PRN8_9NEIS|nr:hypothetical protein [Chitiniphilus eburneus]TJZ71036.1 hypothetical protein FAZ21_13805 [Chitiniphilus eburneus]
MMSRFLTALLACATLLAPLSTLAAPEPEAEADAPAVLVVRGAATAGEAPQVRTFDDAELAALPQYGYTVTTPWYPKPQHFEGPLLRDILKAAGLPGRQLSLRALNDYMIAVPRDDAERYDVIVARKRNGKPMSVRDKGPLFVMYPFDKVPALQQTEYFRRCVWQLSEIDLE